MREVMAKHPLTRRLMVPAAMGVIGFIAAGCSGGTKEPVASPTTTTTRAPLTAVSTTTLPPTSTTTSAVGQTCSDGAIAVSDTGGAEALGHQDQVIVFTNEGQSTCTLSGYPGVAGLDANGHQAVQAQRTVSGYLGGLQVGTSPPNVSLTPGATGSAIVEGTDDPVGTATTCPSYPALLVTPPNLTESTRVTVTGLGSHPSGLAGCSPIEVHPVVAGSGGGAS
jgi:Protein of unknown function (DUF4232)